MAKNESGLFKGKYKDHEITCSVSGYNGRVYFTTPVLVEEVTSTGGSKYEKSKEYETYQSLCDAIDRFELSARKNFTNATAYRVLGRYYQDEAKVEEVTVTSLPDDYHAWIKGSNGERSKVARGSLYSDKTQAELYKKQMSYLDKKYDLDKTKAQEQLNKYLWKPEEK